MSAQPPPAGAAGRALKPAPPPPPLPSLGAANSAPSTAHRARSFYWAALEDYVLAEQAKTEQRAAAAAAQGGGAPGCGSLRVGAPGGSAPGGELAAAQDDAQERTFSPETVARLRGSQPDCEDLLAGNRAWVDKMNREDPEFFKRLGQRQEPRYLYIGCSDARVDPSRLMGLDMGKLFVHRNIGNILSGNDLNLLSVVDFAVNNLRVPHILVVGHYDCGAVRGSISEPEDGGLGIVENWLRNIRDVARFHREELLAIEDREQRHRKLVELNVQEQCLNILKIGTVQRKRLKTFVTESFALPRVHGLVFDPADGVLKKLPLDFKSLIKEDRVIYDLYRLPEAYQPDRRASDKHMSQQ